MTRLYLICRKLPYRNPSKIPIFFTIQRQEARTVKLNEAVNTMNNYDERRVDPIHEMLRLAQNFSNLSAWGFKESFRSVKGRELIYDSEWRRISVVWGGWDPLGGNSISIYYGRLHAPNEDVKMIWNGEECYVWHRFEHELHF